MTTQTINGQHKTARLPATEYLYDVTLRHTGFREFGFTLQDLETGKAIPPQGARINIEFEGRIDGPKLSGTIKGIDYGLIRADGRFELDIHASITTDDGENIAFYADGIFRPTDGAVRENVRLLTASERYEWVNHLQIWAVGNANMQNREILLRAFVAE